MFLALLALYGFGCVLCFFRPAAARTLIAGSIITGMSQLFPILHLLAGAVALGITAHFGMAVIGADTHIDHFTSEVGGWLATVLVGAMVLLCAWALGLVLRLLLPGRWLRANPAPPQSHQAAESA
jgi:hypothetical protein